jgi:hypothetical protein
MLIYDIRYIPKPLEDAYFRTLERLMIKASHFIKGYSFKKGGNVEHDLLKRPQQGWFRNALRYVIYFDNRITILFNQCLA